LLIAAITINAEPNETPHARRFWTCTIITTISALVSAGFSVVGLLAPSSSDSFARYAASRSIALLIAVLFCLGVRSREGIAALALVMSLVQGFDGIIGILAHDPAKTYGPFVFALANFVGLVWLLRPQKGLERRSSMDSTSLRRSQK
jgi:hypothetical protein